MVLALAALNCCNKSTDYPVREVEFIVPWGEGGGTDLVSQELKNALEESTGWRMRAEYRTGGAGVYGHSYLANAQPNGYFIGAITAEVTLMHWQGLTDLTYKDYTPLISLAADAAAVAVRSDSPWVSLQELLAEIENSEVTHLYASGTAKGGIWDLARIGLLRKVGLQSSAIEWVGSQGAESALQMLLRGEIHVLFAGVPELLEAADNDEIRVLAVMAENRPSVLREVPTLKELNIDFAISGWVAVAGPREIPDSIADTIVENIKEVALSRAFQDRLKRAGFEPHVRTGAALVDFLAREDQLNGKLLDWAGLRVR